MLDYHRHAAARLAEHLARHRVDGSVVVSREQRLLQQAKTREPPDPGRIGAWRGVLSAQELQVFEAIAGDTLQEHGDLPPIAVPLITRERPLLGLTPLAIAIRLNVHPNTVVLWCAKGIIGTRVGGRWRVRESELSNVAGGWADVPRR